RSLMAYRESFADKSDIMVLSPDNDFFKYMEQVKP
ncbi:MAG TPA: protease modulator HflC, partial [Pseudomonas sp.]|nr:protease modulator HflC [Pseudomonas sp.]